MISVSCVVTFNVDLTQGCPNLIDSCQAFPWMRLLLVAQERSSENGAYVLLRDGRLVRLDDRKSIHVRRGLYFENSYWKRLMGNMYFPHVARPSSQPVK